MSFTAIIDVYIHPVVKVSSGDGRSIGEFIVWGHDMKLRVGQGENIKWLVRMFAFSNL